MSIQTILNGTWILTKIFVALVATYTIAYIIFNV